MLNYKLLFHSFFITNNHYAFYLIIGINDIITFCIQNLDGIGISIEKVFLH